jgi:murein DD-endopeptidase MepM/ murein hydrolase activator NlpD
MAKTKYFFNPHSLRYEKVKTSIRAIITRIFGFLSASLVFGTILFFIGTRYFPSAAERKLQRENEEYKSQFDFMSKRMDDLSGTLTDLQKRDDKVYREVLGANPISETERESGFGGVDRYKKLQGYTNSEIMIEITKKLDVLTKKAYIQSKSYDELFNLAKNKEQQIAGTPAIQPISNKTLTRVASGFGWRTDPFYHISELHPGIDFTAPMGTPIYATADGVIKSAEFNAGGYGNCVVINHGFGYETLYGHMSKLGCRVGQKVKRGDLIGYVGSTGKSTGPHVHYEVIKNGDKIDPINYFFNDLTASDYEQMRKACSLTNQSFD